MDLECPRGPGSQAESHASTSSRLTRVSFAFPGSFAAATASSSADHGGSRDYRDAVALYWLAEDLAGAERLT